MTEFLSVSRFDCECGVEVYEKHCDEFRLERRLRLSIAVMANVKDPELIRDRFNVCMQC
jgi:hypothetical protein